MVLCAPMRGGVQHPPQCADMDVSLTRHTACPPANTCGAGHRRMVRRPLAGEGTGDVPWARVTPDACQRWPGAHRPIGPSPWPGRGGTEGCAGLGFGRLVVQGVPQDAARQRAGMAPVFEQYLAIDDGVMDTLGEFPNAPAAGREVVHRVLRQRVDGVGVEYCDVGRQARTEQTPIIDAEGGGRLEGQPPHGVLQGHDTLLAHPVAEQPRAVSIAAMELYMGAAVG